MEGLVIQFDPDWRGRRVFLTGHTGFKGGWFSLWLGELGARVHGYALEPPTTPSLFNAAKIGDAIESDSRCDVLNLETLKRAMAKAQPEVVFHLAAQPLVRVSYSEPVRTILTNAIGTTHVLEAARGVKSIRAVVIITTDKVYANDNRGVPFAEGDTLGGHDPYSASKAAAEIVTASYRGCFFGEGKEHPARVATARAGNVIGGGDWAQYRLVPDCMRAFEQEKPLQLRLPTAVRPWQHVLEPISGYTRLAECLLSAEGPNFARAWNFGPDASNDASVGEIADLAAKLWGGKASVDRSQAVDDGRDDEYLHLDSTDARKLLGWKPRWNLRTALDNIIEWHRGFLDGANMQDLTKTQIRRFVASD